MLTTRTTLLVRVKHRSDASAWREFNKIYFPLLVRYARARGVSPADAEDIAQQSMGAISRRLVDFDYAPSKGRFRTWLRAVVERKVVDSFRRRKERIGRTSDFDRPDSGQESPEALWERQWEKEHLRYCMDKLRSEIPVQKYAIFALYAVKEKPAAEVAELLGVTTNQVWVTKTRVLKRLRVMMEELFGDVSANY